MVRRVRLLLLAVLLLLPGQARAAQREERITAKAWALAEAESGRLLLGEREHDRLPMASTTKISSRDAAPVPKLILLFFFTAAPPDTLPPAA